MNIKPSYFNQSKELLDMIKFEHTIFALPFAFLAALAGAQGIPPTVKIFWIVLAMVGARTAAMTFNRLADAELDAANPRTERRALPAGRVGRAGAYALLGAATFLFGVSAGKLGPLCWQLAPLALVIILGYSLCKRFTSYSHLVLGLALAGAPLGAWIAVTGSLEPPAWMLALGVLTWTAGFDILYALQDQDHDRKVGLHSVPVALGTTGALLTSRFLHFTALMAWGRFNLMVGAHLFPWLAWLVVAAILVREQWLVRDGRLDRIDEAFFTLNSLVGMLFFLGHLGERLLAMKSSLL
jgi:4-hydroxybenzoate polyprenyltransferase